MTFSIKIDPPCDSVTKTNRSTSHSLSTFTLHIIFQIKKINNDIYIINNAMAFQTINQLINEHRLDFVSLTDQTSIGKLLEAPYYTIDCDVWWLWWHLKDQQVILWYEATTFDCEVFHKLQYLNYGWYIESSTMIYGHVFISHQQKKPYLYTLGT